MALKYPYYGTMLIRATQDLHALALHEIYDNLHYVQLDLPGVAEPVTGTVMGNGGGAYGLNLFCGPGGFDQYRQICKSPDGYRQIRRQLHLMGYEMLPAGEIEIEGRKWLKKANCRLRRGQLYPDFLIIEPGKRPRQPDDRDVRMLLYAVRGVIQCVKDGSFAPSHVDLSGEHFTLQVGGEVDQPTVSVRYVPVGGSGDADVPSPPRDGQVARGSTFGLAALPRLPAVWMVGVILSPVIGEEPEESAQGVMLVIVDVETGPVGIVPVDTSDAEAIWEALVGVFRGEGGLPEAFEDSTPPAPGLPQSLRIMDEDLYNLAREALAPLNVSCTLEDDDSSFRTMLDTLEGVLFGLDDPDAEEAAERWLDTEPAADDLAAWKEIDRLIRLRTDADAEFDEWFDSSRARNRYFGTDADVEYLLEEYQDMLSVDAYCEWLVTSYRPTRKSKTLAEKWREEPGVPPAVRALLAARAETPPSFYRVAQVDIDGGTVVFHDVLGGPDRTVSDAALAACAEPGFVLPARIISAGDFHFLAPAGPIIADIYFTDVMEFLAAQQVELTPEALNASAHVLGWLWDWYDRELADAPAPALCNTDGDPVILHTATFAVADLAALRRALEDHPFVDWDENEDCFIWFREGVVQPMAGNVTLLGRLRLEGDELLVATNSEKRHTVSRKWLERIPGVTFEGVMVDEMPCPGGPSGGRRNHIEQDIPVESPDEVPQAVRDMLMGHYIAWPDKPLPIFGGKTPRQAARDPALRDKVAAAVRSIPDPPGPDGQTFPAPREMLLKELGLA